MKQGWELTEVRFNSAALTGLFFFSRPTVMVPMVVPTQQELNSSMLRMARHMLCPTSTHMQVTRQPVPLVSHPACTVARLGGVCMSQYKVK